MWQGCVCGGGACVAGGHAWSGVCMAGGMHGGDVCLFQGGPCMVGWGACVAGEMATAADGTHPTAMHSCWSCSYKSTDAYALFPTISIFPGKAVWTKKKIIG